MQLFLREKHPFPLLLYLEWTLLGAAVLATLSFLPQPPHAAHFHPHLPGVLRLYILPNLGVRIPLGAVISIAALGLLGLRSPAKIWQCQVLYTGFGFGLSWLAVLLGGRGERVFPILLLIVVIRACLIFPWRGRILAAIAAYASFLFMLFITIQRIRLFGFPLMRAGFLRAGFPRGARRPPSDVLLLNLTLNSALLFGFVLVFVLLLVGALLAEKQSREKLGRANQRLRQYALLIENQATLQERNRIAREIHDSLGHSLTAQSIQLENVAMLLPKDTEQAGQHLQKARSLGKEALQNVRQSVATLRTHPLKGQSLADALTKLGQEFEQTNRIQLKSHLDLKSPPPLEISTVIYRVVQEAFTNVSKHSQATHVQLDLRQHPQGLSLCFEDNGQGFNPVANTTGFGLQGMRERIEALGGRFSLRSQPGQGCQIQVDIPQSGDPR
ncbi:MAG: sensor histidine kinase [Leptolyngbyaceae cyanobacterium MO_188.B28]|nr:sensor histidine kinase [Leptolyngbyaceae cyanobacterium MO_188.B28]